MKRILVLVLMLATSAMCWPREEFDRTFDGNRYLFAGYSQTPTFGSTSLDIDFGTSVFPFKGYNMEIGFDFLHFQIAMTENFQKVSDESLWSLITIAPFAASFGAALLGAPNEFRYVGEIGMFAMAYLWRGTLFFPVTPDGWFGIINKHRFITQIISKGWHLKSFTFQDDFGLRFYIDRGWKDESKDHSHDRYRKFFIDAGCRFEKNFVKDAKYKLFLQVGHSSY